MKRENLRTFMQLNYNAAEIVKMTSTMQLNADYDEDVERVTAEHLEGLMNISHSYLKALKDVLNAQNEAFKP